MEDFVLTFGTLLLLSATSHAQIRSQQDLDSLASSLMVTWDVITNTREESRYEVELTLMNPNTNTVSLINDAWQLHLSAIYMIEPDLLGKFGHTTAAIPGQQLTVTHVKGSHFYFSPTREFGTLPPGGNRKIKFKVQYWSVSRSDSMPNWYLTYPNLQPRVITSTAGESLSFVGAKTRVEQVKRYDHDRYMPFTPQDRFERYHLVAPPDSPEIRLVPAPLRVTVVGGDAGRSRAVSLDTTWTISYPDVLSNEATYLRGVLNIAVNLVPESVSTNFGPGTAKVIRLETGSVTFTSGEEQNVLENSGDAYNLNVDVDAQRITVVGQEASGVLYGVVSLGAIAGPNGSIPEYSITDGPRFEYRGFMLDIARNFHSAQEIRNLIEVMAMYKLNKLHLRLADDEGWRLEIVQLPELTQLGANQCYDPSETRCLLTEIGAGPSENREFLTAADYRSILALARDRHVTVIPEVDMPGHARAAIKSMELRMSTNPSSLPMLLTEPGDTSRYLSPQMFSDNALNPCLESAYNFINVVIDELINLHNQGGQPLEVFHFGGDEVARGAWENSTSCRTLREAGRLPHDSVKAYFVQRLSQLASDKGVSLGAWEDGLMEEANIPFNRSQNPVDDVYGYAWNNVWEWGTTPRTYSLANAGYKVVLVHASNMYFDHPYEPDPEERGYYWATRFTDTKKAFSYNAARFYDNISVRRSGEPIDRERHCRRRGTCPALTRPENIAGMQGALFSETSRTEAQFHSMVFPRILATAERAWHKAEWEEMSEGAERDASLASDWSGFAHAVSDREFSRLESRNVFYRVPPPAARLQNGVLQATTEFPGFDVSYIVDGGVRWSRIAPAGVRPVQGVESLLLRTSSKDGTRFSRIVEMSLIPAPKQTNMDVVELIGKNLQVAVSVLDNYGVYGDDFFLGSIRLRNSGDVDIPTGNWRIYFATFKMLEPEALLRDQTFFNSTVGLSLEHVQGPLLSLGPTADFSGIKAHQQVIMYFKAEGSSVSPDDFLPNWYVTAPGLNPRDIVSTTGGRDFVTPYTAATAYTRTRDDQFGPWTPESRYERNAAWEAGDDVTVPPVIPTPVQYTRTSNDVSSLLDGSWAVVSQVPMSEIFIEWVLRFFPECQISSQLSTPSGRYFLFRQGEISESSSPEAYNIRVNTDGNIVEVTSRSSVGAFRAAATILQLLLKTLPNKPIGSLPNCNIVDYPRFSHRSFYLDAARFFMPKDDVFRLLDTMALYKYNKLSFHLGDDEGWRLEIPGFPELTEIGSNRCHDLNERDCLLDTLGTDPSKLRKTDQYYTSRDYIEILQYAQARSIDVIPDFDMPGHSRASIRAMLTRWQRDTDLGQGNQASQYLLHEIQDTTRYTTPQYYTENIVNPCLRSTYTFIGALYTTVEDIYRGSVGFLPAIYMGGQDVPPGPWRNSTICQESINRGRDLLTYFSLTAAQQLPGASLGMSEDLLFPDDNTLTPVDRSQFPNPDVISTVYRSVPDLGVMGRAYNLANAGYKVVMAPASHVSFDHAQEPDPVEGGNVWAARYIDTLKTFSFMPFRYYDNGQTTLSGEAITRESVCQQDGSGCPPLSQPENIIGLQGVMKTLRVKSLEEFEFQVYPRLLALAERAWHRASWENIDDAVRRRAALKSDWASFAASLGQNDLGILDKLSVAYRIPPPGVKRDGSKLLTNVEFPGLKVQYQIVGVTPTTTWIDLEPSTTFDNDRDILLRTASPNGARASRKVKVSMAKAGKPDGAVRLEGSRSYLLGMATLVTVMVFWRAPVWA